MNVRVPSALRFATFVAAFLHPGAFLGVFLSVFLGVFAAPATADAAERVVRYATRTMGTVGTVALVTTDSSSSSSTAAEALEAFRTVDARLSNWDPGSELSAVNRNLDAGPVPLEPETAQVLRAALSVAERSGGAFDPTVEPLVRLWGFLGGRPTVPAARDIERTLGRVGHVHLRLENGLLWSAVDGLRVDLGAIAKGHAVDRAIDALRANGVAHALVDLSGNMRGIGRPPGRDAWAVGVRDPDSASRWFARLTLGPDAVATSGNYEQFVDVDGRRYGHVLDPRTGWPVEGLDAVTVLAPTAMAADAWATALLVAGPENGRRLARSRDDLHAVLVQSARDGRRVVWVESTLRDRFVPVHGSADRFDLRWF